jgi:hypothetical protein
MQFHAVPPRPGPPLRFHAIQCSPVPSHAPLVIQSCPGPPIMFRAAPPGLPAALGPSLLLPLPSPYSAIPLKNIGRTSDRRRRREDCMNLAGVEVGGMCVPWNVDGMRCDEICLEAWNNGKMIFLARIGGNACGGDRFEGLSGFCGCVLVWCDDNLLIAAASTNPPAARGELRVMGAMPPRSWVPCVLRWIFVHHS